MEFLNTNKIALVKSIMRFYQERLAIAADAIFPVTNPLTPPPFPSAGEFYVGIAVGDGQFPLAENCEEQLRENCAFTAMGYSRMQLDGGRRENEFILNETLGALAIQAKLLS